MPPPAFSPTLPDPEAGQKLRATRKSEPPAHSPLLPAVKLRKKLSAGILTTSTSSTGARTARITTTASACPAAAAAAVTGAHTSTATPFSRNPLKTLKHRDQNAPQSANSKVMKPGSDPKANPPTARTTARMPSYERPTVAGQARQPQLPTVGKVVNSKSPLTPKVATRPTSTPHPQNPALATPLPRRPRPESLQSTLAANGTGSRDTPELTSPVSAFLASNITPRSGSRQSRVESANSTPNGTPNPERHNDAWDMKSTLGMSPPVPDDEGRRPLVTFSPASEVSGVGRPDLDSKFFYAADARRQPPPLQQQQPHHHHQQQQRGKAFFYASGVPVPERQSSNPGPLSPSLASPSLHSQAQDPLMSKFIYANGAAELQPAPKIGPSSSGSGSAGSVVSTSSRIPTGKKALRATSPSRPEPQFATISSTTKSGHNTPLVSPRSPVSMSQRRRSQGKAVTLATSSRPVSMTSEPKQPRPKSLTMAEPPIVAKIISAHNSPGPSSEATSPLNPTLPIASPFLPSNPPMGGFASLLQAAEDFAEADDSKPESLNSPTKSASQEKEVTDLVANARRERKVQDLQITNASLEAINRTLERQLRKQTAELRRYKRLSRISLASVGSRVVSASTVNGAGPARAGMGLDDLSEEQSKTEAEDAELEELEEMNDEDEYNSESDHSRSSGSGAEAQREARYKRDERRLQVDLSKHQQMLIDSQKMNQSLKRCLGWTEELIKEGKRALAYRVQMNEVKLPGRVLTAEEIEARNRQQLEEAEDGNLSDEEDLQEDPKDDADFTDDLKDDSLYGDNPRLDDLDDATTDDLRDDSLYGDNPRLDDLDSVADDLRDDSLYGDNPRLDDLDSVTDDLRDDSLYGDNPRLDDDLANTPTDDEQQQKPWDKPPHDRDSGIELPADGG